MTTKLSGLSLMVWTNDVAETVAFYLKLGFHNRSHTEGLGDLARESVHILVMKANETHPHGTVYFDLSVDKASTLRRELKGVGVEVNEEELSGHGALLGFVVRDPNGVPLHFQGLNH